MVFGVYTEIETGELAAFIAFMNTEEPDVETDIPTPVIYMYN